MRKIILFNGPPRSGKDTATDFAMKHLGKRGIHYRFAAPLKDATHSLFGLKVPREYFDECKNTPSPLFLGLSPRQAYIWMSEEAVKPKFGKDFFAKVAVHSIAQRIIESKKTDGVVVISDCGFAEEVAALIEAFGQENVALVHIKRPGTDFTNDSRSYIKIDGFLPYLLNNDLGLGDLRDKTIGIVKDFTNAN